MKCPKCHTENPSYATYCSNCAIRLKSYEDIDLTHTSTLTRYWSLITSKSGGLLSLSALLYVFGYLVWSIHAWMEGFGPLPAVKAQYLLAGVVPALLTYAVYLMLKGVRLWFKLTQKWLGPDATGIGKTIRKMSPPLFAILILLLAISAVLHLPDTIIRIFIYVFCLLLIIIPEPLRLPNSKKPSLIGLWRRFIIYYGVISIAVVAYIFNIEIIHSKIPQELGGMRPVKACLDLDVSKFSRQTLDDFIIQEDRDVPRSKEEGLTVLRSKKIDVLFSGGDLIVAKVEVGDDYNKKDTRIYRLKRDSVYSILWMD